MSRTELEELRWKQFPIGSDGFVCLVDIMGDDSSIVQAARCSYGNDIRLHAGTPEVQEKLEELFPNGGDSHYVVSQDEYAWSIQQINAACEAVKSEHMTKDRTLIRYLMRHRHTTPFEMAELKFLVRVPMDCWRQWIRHRTACLAGDTILSFDLPCKANQGKYRHTPRTIKQVFELWTKGTQQSRDASRKSHYVERVNKDEYYTATQLATLVERTDVHVRQFVKSGRLEADKSSYPMTIKGEAWHQYSKECKNTKFSIPMRERVQCMMLRSIDESTGGIIHTRIVDIWESGEKEVFQVTFSNGNTLKASKDHLCFTEMGWLRLEEALARNVLFYSTSQTPAPEPFEVPLEQSELESELWKDIPGFMGYQASNLGRIRSFLLQGGGKNKLVDKPKLKTQTVSAGRKVVNLCRDGSNNVWHVHRLILLAFIGELPNNMVSRHLDGNCWNNRLSNLTYGTHQENTDDRMVQGGHRRLTSILIDVASVKSLGYQMTYDLEVDGPYHNFFAGGVVVHNSVNEYSTRYTEAIDSIATTKPEEWRLQAENNKQGSEWFLKKWPVVGDYGSIEGITPGEYLSHREQEAHQIMRDLYKERLDFGIAKEQARKDLPLSNYTTAYWKINLHNLLHFLSLRMDSHAQQEIREYATTIGEQIVKPLFPVAWEAFSDYRLGGTFLSRLDNLAIQNLVQCHDKGLHPPFSPADFEHYHGVSEWYAKRCRERDECLQKLQKLGLVRYE